MNRAIIRLSTVGIASLMALAISAASAQDTVAQVIGRVN
jgi:hypothetical protein